MRPRKPKEAAMFESHTPKDEREPESKPKRTKKKTLGEHAAEFLKQYNKGCTKSRRCALLSAVLAITKEDKKPGPGIEEGLSFSTKAGYQGAEVVYYARRSQYVVMNHCPFCGGKIARRK